MTLRILYLDHTGELGGAERSLLDILQRLAPEAVSPFLATGERGELADRARACGVTVWQEALDHEQARLTREAFQRAPWRFALAARHLVWVVIRLAWQVRRARIHGIHTNTLKAHVIGSAVAWLTGVPIIWHMRDLPSTRGDVRRLLARLTTWVNPYVIAISQSVADDVSAIGAASVRVVHNGIDCASVDAWRAAKTDDTPDNLPGEAMGVTLPPEARLPVVGVVSHLIPWKGQDVFLRAVARLVAQGVRARYVVVGDDIFQFKGERLRLEGLAHELGVAEHVTFTGHREDVWAAMAALDVFVLPSLYEPFGRVLLEAMAVGVPVVATRAGGVPEIVKDGVTGHLVPPGDAEALAEAMLTLLEDPGMRARLREAGRARVQQCFSLEATLAGVMAVYDNAFQVKRTVAD